MAKRVKTKSISDIVRQQRRIANLAAQKMGFENTFDMAAQTGGYRVYPKRYITDDPWYRRAVEIAGDMMSNIRNSQEYKEMQRLERENSDEMGFSRYHPENVQVGMDVYTGKSVSVKARGMSVT